MDGDSKARRTRNFGRLCSLYICLPWQEQLQLFYSFKRTIIACSSSGSFQFPMNTFLFHEILPFLRELIDFCRVVRVEASSIVSKQLGGHFHWNRRRLSLFFLVEFLKMSCSLTNVNTSDFGVKEKAAGRPCLIYWFNLLTELSQSWKLQLQLQNGNFGDRSTLIIFSYFRNDLIFYSRGKLIFLFCLGWWSFPRPLLFVKTLHLPFDGIS